MGLTVSDIILTVVVVLCFMRERQYWMNSADQRRRSDVYEKLVTRLKKRNRELLTRINYEGKNPKPLSSEPHLDSIFLPGTQDGSFETPFGESQSLDAIGDTDAEQ